MVRPVAPHDADSRSPHLRVAFGAAMLGLVATFVATAAPIPQYNTYRAEQGFTNADISLTVVGYFAGTIVSLLVLSRLSNHLGRRPTAIVTMLVLAAGAAVLLDVRSIAVLVIGRMLMGVGAGLASSCLTAYIVDAAPATPHWIGAVASSQAPNLGLTLGAIGSGALVQYGPWPRTLVYVLVIVLLLASAVVLALGAETVRRAPGVVRSLRPRVHLPARTWHLLPAAAAIMFSTWATGAFYQAFVPALVIDQLHTRSSLVMGLVFSAFIAPNVLGAPVGGRFSPATGERVGMAVFLLGMAGIVTGLAIGSLLVFVLASVVAGAGQGIAVSAMVRGILHGSAVEDRGAIFGGVYLLSYLGAAIPSFISGQLSRTFTTFELACGYGVLALVATVLVAVLARNPLRLTGP
ncbi:MAG: MFS transporter [Propionibacteriaceae bacterium]